jgi:hypothetical protein
MYCSHLSLLLWLCIAPIAVAAKARASRPVEGQLVTRWADDVWPDDVWPEYRSRRGAEEDV